MQQRVNGLLQELTNVYIIFILVLLPLYMKERMVMIGDAKYYFFRDVTVLFLIIALFALMLYGIAYCLEKNRKNNAKKIRFSVQDFFVASYGVLSITSCIFSQEKEIALWGYQDWYMGAFTQGVFVAIYFIVSRFYNGTEDLWKLAGVTAMVVFVLGILNRFQIDPLNIYEGMKENDWNRTHLLSTIGNNNWYCGYISVTAGISIYFYNTINGKWRLLAGMATFLTYITLLTQGSESGYVLMAGIMGVLCYVSLDSREKFLRAWETILMFPLACVVLNVIHSINPKIMIMDDEGTEGIWALWNGWIIVLAVTAIVYIWLSYRHFKKMEEKKKMIMPIRITMIVVVVVGLLALIGYVSTGKNMNWGTGRGALWYVSIRCFLEGDWKQKLIGAGPDCFAPYVYNSYNINDMVQVSHRWKDIIYASAHNEWLNMLVTQGVLGLMAYLGIFVSGMVRCLKRIATQPILLLGLLMLAGYTANATFSFQHVMATPFAFVMLGMTEAAIRK